METSHSPTLRLEESRGGDDGFRDKDGFQHKEMVGQHLTQKPYFQGFSKINVNGSP